MPANLDNSAVPTGLETVSFHSNPKERQWHPTPVFLPGESQGWGSLVGCRLWGRTESGMTEGDLAAAVAAAYIYIYIYIYIVEYYSVIKKNKIMPFATMWM